MTPSPPLGAHPTPDGVTFSLWAPKAHTVTLVLEPSGDRRPMQARGASYFSLAVPGLSAGARYRYSLDDGAPFPDPASRFQPEGVHGPSEVVDPVAYAWHDAAWQGRVLETLVFYELHVGTFTPEGTFRSTRERLAYLKDLGVNAVELMPVADFPGRWNWGYDPAALYAPSRAYGTPDDLRALVDAAHQLGLAVFLDVIYNHLGPDGAYLAAYAPMFTDRHHTPWGKAVNLDDAGSEGVRHLFIDNALHWLREYHVDGLRLDATHALLDDSPQHFLAALSEAVAALDEGPRRWLVAEDPRNLNTLLRPRSEGGYGLDAVWADDLHHQIRNMTAGDVEGYYADFAGSTMQDVAETLRRGWFFDGTKPIVTDRPPGTDASGIGPEQCVVCIQNHDQVGNRPRGTRLTDDVPLPVYKAATGLLLFAPGLPLLFMGQEWGASSPFLFFTDHEPELGKLVTEGRKEEFTHFSGFTGDVPDPQDPGTFYQSKLDWDERTRPPHAHLAAYYRDLLALRRTLGTPFRVHPLGDRSIHLIRGDQHLLVTFDRNVSLALPSGTHVRWHSEQPAYAPEPRPPHVADGVVTFAVPGALLCA